MGGKDDAAANAKKDREEREKNIRALYEKQEQELKTQILLCVHKDDQIISDITLDKSVLTIDFMELSDRIKDFGHILLTRGLRYLTKLTSEVVYNYAVEDFKQSKSPFILRFRNINAELVTSSALNHEYIDKLVTVRGTVAALSEKKACSLVTIYSCLGCKLDTVVDHVRGEKLKSDTKCIGCESKAFKVKSRHYTTFAFMRLEQLTEDMEFGGNPVQLEVRLFGPDLYDKLRTGDKILLTGVMKAVATKKQAYEDNDETFDDGGINTGMLFDMVMEAEGVEKLDTADEDMSKLTKEDIEQIQDLCSDEHKACQFYEKVVRSYAPWVEGWDHVKEGMAVVLARSYVSAVGKSRVLGTKDIFELRKICNTLVVGDPGVSKTQIVKFALYISPRSYYTVGSGSTEAGLTAAVMKDKYGMMKLEAGILVKGDQGLVVIDEFGTIRKDDISGLHEAMEQNTVSIAKGGITATMPARTSINCVMNPVYGKYNPFEDLLTNVGLKVPILTRFDLVYIARDIHDPERDGRVADRVLMRHSRDPRVRASLYRDCFYEDFLKKIYIYIGERKDLVDIDISEEAHKIFKDYYLKWRAAVDKLSEEESSKIISITPRSLETLVRLGSNIARMKLKNVIGKWEAERAIKILDDQNSMSGVNIPVQLEDGSYMVIQDQGKLIGQGHNTLLNLKKARDIIYGFLGDGKNESSDKAIIEELVASGFEELKAKDMLAKLYQSNVIMYPKRGIVAWV